MVFTEKLKDPGAMGPGGQVDASRGATWAVGSWSKSLGGKVDFWTNWKSVLGDGFQGKVEGPGGDGSGWSSRCLPGSDKGGQVLVRVPGGGKSISGRIGRCGKWPLSEMTDVRNGRCGKCRGWKWTL